MRTPQFSEAYQVQVENVDEQKFNEGVRIAYSVLDELDGDKDSWLLAITDGRQLVFGVLSRPPKHEKAYCEFSLEVMSGAVWNKERDSFWRYRGFANAHDEQDGQLSLGIARLDYGYTGLPTINLTPILDEEQRQLWDDRWRSFGCPGIAVEHLDNPALHFTPEHGLTAMATLNGGWHDVLVKLANDAQVAQLEQRIEAVYNLDEGVARAYAAFREYGPSM